MPSLVGHCLVTPRTTKGCKIPYLHTGEDQPGATPDYKRYSKDIEFVSRVPTANVGSCGRATRNHLRPTQSSLRAAGASRKMRARSGLGLGV